MYPPEPYKARKKRHAGPSLPRSPFSPFSAFGRGRRARLGRKDVALTLLGVLLVYLVYTAWGPGSARREPESVRLQRLMNDEASARRVWDVTSSFDWGAIDFRYPPPSDPAPLPTGAGAGAGARKKKKKPGGLLPRVQHRFPPETAAARAVREARRDEVRAVFQKSWRSYRRFAWMQDALLPVSGGGRDQFSGWSATLVDALDTLWIMGMREEFDEAVDAVARIDFGQATNPRVNMFETNIRYLGGLMAAYDLSGRSVLLAKAVELGDMLFAGFNTRSRMPVDFFDMGQSQSGKGLEVEGGVVAASPGTLLLEFTRLTQLTGDPKYYGAIAPIADLFHAGQNQTNIPGIWPQWVSMSTPDVVSGYFFSLGSGADSLFEYTVKMHVLLGGHEPKYAAMSAGWMDAGNEHLLFRPMLPGADDVLLAANAKAHQRGGPVERESESEHLACFLGGAYALGGRVLEGREDLVGVGARLAHGCAWAYRVMPTGMMPERFGTVPCESRDRCPWSQARWDEESAGRPDSEDHLPLGVVSAKDKRYILRPEAIESLFVLWRVTGRPEFQEAAWDMFRAVANGTETEYANAAVMDVTRANYPLEKEDYMESFWLAETLKYFYLALSPPDLISLDDFVLNTEAHPFRRPA
ncbi:hypothetical protein KVR01_012514 [Diaporthe batatas]|uniref:uncharacterized protein n=1 Tax=Diaporthe batatas TaxID=748121 RepID=UPI001D04E9CA|nr:uncharacterized protein KVR01_012514 [Diaporthe batatas]KAG8157852.1 hypothetical protein KVR01_012514 [Diaporthe batatas]